jgi:hypothetical protein
MIGPETGGSRPVFGKVRTAMISRQATVRGEAGDATGARDMLLAALPRVVRVFGDRDLNTSIFRRNLAYWTAKAGDPASARAQMEELLRVREEVLGRRILGRWQHGRISRTGPARRATGLAPSRSCGLCCRFASACPGPATRQR